MNTKDTAIEVGGCAPPVIVDTPNAQSWPSAWIGELRKELRMSAMKDVFHLSRDEVIELLGETAINIMSDNPPAGARDAVCDYGSLAHRLYCAIACNGDSACIFGADPVVRERWLSGVEEVLGKATQPAAPRTRHPLAHRERMCERVSTNPEPQPAAPGAGECSHSWRDYVQAEYKATPAITLGESNIARYVKIGRMCEECGKVETNTAAPGMGDASLRALSNLAAPGLFEHDAEHASVIGGGAAPGCAGDKCVHHTIVIEDADLQFMVAAANHVRTALAAQPAPVVGGDDDWVLAPKDPTEEMIQRGLLLGDTPNHITIVYQSMLAAAPKPTAPLAARPGGEGEPTRLVTIPLNDATRFILGRPNFVCGPYAHLMRAAGIDIRTKAEDEQAAVLHWMLNHYLAHGDDFQDKCNADLAAWRAAIAHPAQAVES